MNIFLDTVGCRLNQSEIEAYALQFRSAGHSLVQSPELADLVVINTCSVTAAASSDSRQKIRQAARVGAGRVAVTGCWSTLQPKQATALPGVEFVIPNQEKDHLVWQVLKKHEQPFDLEPVAREPIPGARLRTRAFIKAQDGCNNRCTFCITTLARGNSRSRSIREIVRDIQLATANNPDNSGTPGSLEVVLTGVHLGSWGYDLEPALKLKDLVTAVLQDTEVPRLRLSSLEPWDLDQSFFDLWQNRRLCRQLHLPLQSGSAATLRRMARKTTPEDFARLVAAARASIPEVAITTDLIVGFPGESQAEFEESLEFAGATRFAGGHVFTYSARPGTAAARMSGQIEPGVRKSRNQVMRQVLQAAASEYRRPFIGRDLEVLWETARGYGPQGWQLNGLTDNYLRIRANFGQALWNTISTVHIVGEENEELVGEIQGSV